MAAKRKTTKKVTYTEFLSWLEGVESMQEPDWTPSPVQWKTIRQKLDTVKPDVAEPTTAKRDSTPQPMQPPVDPRLTGPSAFAPQIQPQRPPVELTNVPRQQSEHEGVPAATTAPVLNPDGTPAAPGSEFL